MTKATILLFVSSSLVAPFVAADLGLRAEAQRLRKPDDSFHSPSLTNLFPDYGKYLKSMVESPLATLKKANVEEAQLEHDEEEANTVIETIDAILAEEFMSMAPSDSPSTTPSAKPSVSPAPTGTASPSNGPTVSSAPTISDATTSPTEAPTAGPTPEPSAVPTSLPTASPTSSPTAAPTTSPTFAHCGMAETDRIVEILAILDSVADPDLIRNNAHPQGLATTWLIEEDLRHVCPDTDSCGLIQRWTLAVIYFSTNGDGWFQCSSNPAATDLCGAEEPFVGETRFLSEEHECEWAGISCIDLCVTEIEFEENNLVGTIPTEIGLLEDLAIWGMERGGLEGPIPTEIGKLTNLIFLDLDFNQLSGSLSSELLSLTSLTQLDLNNNRMTGSINGIGVFPDLEFLQLHDVSIALRVAV